MDLSDDDVGDYSSQGDNVQHPFRSTAGSFAPHNTQQPGSFGGPQMMARPGGGAGAGDDDDVDVEDDDGMGEPGFGVDDEDLLQDHEYQHQHQHQHQLEDGAEPDSAQAALDAKTPLYDPAAWAGVTAGAPPDVQALFGLITRHRPAPVVLGTRLRPFIPDLIPATGDIDAFLKPARPDGKEEMAGLTQLDEPALAQSDPAALDMRLRRDARKAGLAPVAVRSIAGADKHPERVRAWLQQVATVHRDAPAATVTYAKAMPPLAQLTRVWPAGFEHALRAATLPGAGIALTPAQVAQVCCAVLDIPVHAGRQIDALHLMSSLYAECKANSHAFGAGAGHEAAGAQAQQGK